MKSIFKSQFSNIKILVSHLAKNMIDKRLTWSFWLLTAIATCFLSGCRMFTID